MKRKIGTLLLLCVCLCQTYAEKRLALIIGNSEYGKNNYLENPVHDADDVSSKLFNLGFEVTKLKDGTLRQMDEFISDFGRRAKSYDVVLFYYSGHGLQSQGGNYLMPIDAELDSEADVRYKCLPLNLLLDKLDESNCPMKIVILDACRNNPFLKRWYRGDNARGLAYVNPPKDTFVTFSTAAGSVALDGTGRHSPFTKAFLETLDVPNLSLLEFFNEVGKKVLAETNGGQDPWMNHSTMKGNFYFNQSLSMQGLKRLKAVSVVPNWIDNKKDEEWIGVSVPMSDREKARTLAIVNAVLKYMFSEGGIPIRLLGEMDYSNFQTEISEGFCFSESRKSLDVISLLKNFDFDIKQEYFNNNNEYFVLCTIRKSESSPNAVRVTRNLQVDETSKSLYVTLSVEAVINNEYTRIDYNYSKSSFFNGCHHLLIDSIEIAKPAVDYEDRNFMPDSDISSYPLVNISECGSLGLAEIAMFAQYPVAPDIMYVYTSSDMVGRGDTNVFKNLSHIKADESTMPIHAKIVQIKNKYLCVSIQDPYETLKAEKQKRAIMDISPLPDGGEGMPDDFCRLINTDTMTVEYGESTMDPILLKKTLTLFESAIMMCQKEASQIVGQYQTDSVASDSLNFDTSFTSSSDTEVSDYYPFFFLDGMHSDLRPTPVVKEGLAIVRFKQLLRLLQE